jgi:hypothetical protein
MPTPRETRAALQLLTTKAVATGAELFKQVPGSAEARRFALLNEVPDLIGYFSDGSAALAADFYEEERELAGARRAFTPELVVVDRVEKQRRAVAWATEPLFDSGDEASRLAAESLSGSRLAEVIQLDVARPFRDTITVNRRTDPDAVGWRRVTRGGCGFCRMLAGRGAVYKDSTARFAAHRNCHCIAQPVFVSNDTGIEASVIQYKASRRSSTPASRASLRAYIETYYPD